MTYFCFVESEILNVPHMEPLLSDTADEAVREARDLMHLHSSAIAAHVFDGDERIATIMPEEPHAGALPKPSRTPPFGDKPSA